MFQEFQQHVNSRRKIHVETRCSCHSYLNGYLLGLSDTFGLMHCFHDFLPDGYTLFRLNDVISIRSNEYERFWDRMLASEGLLTGLDKNLNMNLTSIQSSFLSLTDDSQTLIIEAQIPDEEDQDFYIGQVATFDTTKVWFNHFDALGKWELEPAEIPLDEISFIQFDTPYIKTFSKYVESTCPAKTEQFSGDMES